MITLTMITVRSANEYNYYSIKFDFKNISNFEKKMKCFWVLFLTDESVVNCDSMTIQFNLFSKNFFAKIFLKFTF